MKNFITFSILLTQVFCIESIELHAQERQNNIDETIIYLERLVKNDPNNLINLLNLSKAYDSKVQIISNDLGKVQAALEEGDTKKLDRRLLAEKDKLAAYDSEVTSLNAKLKKEPKTAAATKKRIVELTQQKVEIEKGVTSLMSEIEKKKDLAADNTKLKAQAEKLTDQRKEAKNKAIENYQKVLAKDSNNYEALYNMAVLSYNEGVEIKKAVDYMDLATYRREGKVTEDKACVQFAISKPYFERALRIKPTDNITSSALKDLEKILVKCGDISPNVLNIKTVRETLVTDNSERENNLAIRNEAEEWILSKLNQYGNSGLTPSTGNFNKTISFKILDNNLVIEQKVYPTTIIPIKDIGSYSYEYQEGFRDDALGYVPSFVAISLTCKYGSQCMSSYKKDSGEFFMSTNEEKIIMDGDFNKDNLPERFRKALSDLVKHYGGSLVSEKY